MYNVVLATVLLAGGEATAWPFACHGCHGCYGYPGYYHSTCHGCTGNYYSRCYGCSGCSGCSGCYGSWGYRYYSAGCSGCWGCSGGGVVIAMPAYSTCHGCWGCYGSVVTMPAAQGAPLPGSGSRIMPDGSVLTMPGAGDPSITPKTMGEREAVEKLLKELREKKMKQGKDKGPPEESLAPSAPTSPAVAQVRVTLPANARLWVDQVECPLTSGVRSFDTPLLQPGQTYYYTLRVEIPGSGAPTESRRVLVRAGEQTAVNFNGATTTAQR
jgi:uncharacterized protein (TIGR03000 family)